MTTRSCVCHSLCERKHMSKKTSEQEKISLAAAENGACTLYGSPVLCLQLFSVRFQTSIVNLWGTNKKKSLHTSNQPAETHHWLLFREWLCAICNGKTCRARMRFCKIRLKPRPCDAGSTSNVVGTRQTRRQRKKRRPDCVIKEWKLLKEYEKKPINALPSAKMQSSRRLCAQKKQRMLRVNKDADSH